VDTMLQLYDPGHPSMKPDVLQQIREKLQKNMQNTDTHTHTHTSTDDHSETILKTVITFKAPNAIDRVMTVEELIRTVQTQAEKLEKMRELCDKKVRQNSDLLATIKDRDEVIASQLETIERQGALLDSLTK